jgi:hypothetical protein
VAATVEIPYFIATSIVPGEYIDLRNDVQSKCADIEKDMTHDPM